MEQRFGLLGKTLSHSYSAEIHRAFGLSDYQLFEKQEDKLLAFIRQEWEGFLNVTIPYKKLAMKACDSIDQQALCIGSVNTLIQRSGTIVGYNTDIDGFRFLLQSHNICLQNKKVLIFGNGGASLTAQFCAKEQHARECLIISRCGKNNYENLSCHKDAEILINATPVGMFPHNGSSPCRISDFPNCEAVVDMIYNPLRTQLLMQAEQNGISYCNGLPMLVAQAQKAQQLYDGKEGNENETARVLSCLQKQKENIILIGMPGCGKSTIGELLARQMGREWVDTDTLIEEKVRMSIPTIFQQCGEDAFRSIETEILKEVGKQNHLVISCGGGVVTRDENYPLLHQNGQIYRIERDLSLLAIEDRPLSQKKDLKILFQKREPQYLAFADASFSNHLTPQDTAQQIRRYYDEATCH